MDFEDRLQKAIQRGHKRKESKEQQAAADQLSREELKRLHSGYRLQLSEQIEKCIGQLPQHFPGFQFETVVGERGWGAACSRDDLRLDRGGRRSNDYSRLEITVRPFSDLGVLNLTAKGTIRNKEAFNRNFFEPLADADIDKFHNLVNVWVLEYAEMYAASD